MEGLTTAQAKSKLLQILKEYRYLNKKQPVSHVHLYVKSIWFFEILVDLYGVFLVFNYIFLSKTIESLIIGIFLLLLPLRYIYYKANRSKFQWEIFDDRINKIKSLVKKIEGGEDMSDVTLRDMNNTISEVFRDQVWVKLPSVVLLEGDLVALRPGMFLPAQAVGVEGVYQGKLLEAYEVLPDFDSPDILIAKAKVKFIMKASPSQLLLQQLLTDRALQKKRTSTFYMICLKLANKIFFYYILIVIILNLIFSGVWTGLKSVKFHEVLLEPAFLILCIMIVILPSLLHLLTCWGNALLWCICESLDKEKSANPYTRSKVEQLDSILKTSRPLEVNLFDKKHLAEEAESDFDNEEMVSLFPPVQILECISICRSFLIGGLQRDLNILDLLNNTTIMSFIDKEGIISENARYADEVIVMGQEGKITALDLVHESPLDIQCGNSDQDQIAFIGNTWEEHLESLKPLGLATSVSRNPRLKDTCKTLINLNNDHSKLLNTGELFFLRSKDEIEIFEECACVIGKLIGFTESAISEHQHHCTLWSTWRPNETENLHDISYRRINKNNNLNRDSAVTDYIEKRISQAKRINTIQERLLRPCHLLTSIIEKNQGFEVFSQGNPRVILQNCKQYYDGNSLRPLEEEYLQKLNTALLQWTADDYDALAFSYKPLINEEIESVFREKRLEDNDDSTREILQGVQKGHIFLGMIAITNHPKSEANHFIEDVFDAGIRFVIFSEGDLLETKAFGDDLGLYTAWNSCISLSSESAMVEEEGLNLDGMKVLPQGINEIRARLIDYNDTVPLLVSMFSDSNKSNILEMIKIYQENGEVVTVIGGCLHTQNTTIYQTADVSIGVKAQPCGFCSTCFGYRINYKHRPGILETVSERLISLPCTFTLGLEHPLYVVLQVVKEARKFMANIQNGLMFASASYVCWCSLACIFLIFGIPPVLTLLQCAYICLVLIPTLTLSFLSTPSEESLMKKLPIKVDILKLLDNSSFFSNLSMRITLCLAVAMQTHIWALSLLSKEIAFYSWENNGLLLVQLCNFWLGIFLICIFSTSYINGSQSWFHVKNIENYWWIAIVIINLAIGTIIVVIYLGIYSAFGDFKNYLSSSWYIYVAIIIEDIALFFCLELLNLGVANIVKSVQKTLDVYFQTKLGIYSPK